MSNSLDPDLARRIVEYDLGPNCLPRLSADDTGRQRLKNPANQKTIFSSLIDRLEHFGNHKPHNQRKTIKASLITDCQVLSKIYYIRRKEIHKPYFKKNI